ncbi:MAG: hypothetical protein KJO12_06645 [Ignavibacteria bacterium]|nr:hypothetical protein [Ignavibacteria bacterium]
MEFKLYNLENKIKLFLSVVILTLSIGVLTGLVYLYNTTNLSSSGTIQRLSGSSETSDFDIPDSYPKPISELLITTHNHIIGFSFIFFIVGGVFYFNSIVIGFWKSFLMIEPLISIVITFGSIWLIRFVSTDFVFVAIVSSSLIYISFFIMIVIVLHELIFKKAPLST